LIRALRWALLVLLLGAGAYLVVAVDFTGATLLDRILGRVPSKEAREAPAQAGDGLSEEDRRGLDRLIESKLKEKKKGGSGP
jgi:hypothetical protein